ncbi:unnamed protein product [Didymodactylos carnosus]|uniref:Protein sleepless n=1 Tax=Didymodactylos carnosus TaxID=1234261 RepID=A0A815BZN0_9BILA|nr:unnamed protein product [Didymodactylos carnosus]CAF1277234.1 unnamed protein product [Didymodactylos carnosus]CAF4050638.1 unnamed protein product [Didymodactylos carnosus]CAF4069691.1 unnamed protein product [Didymodactylos carnosus]
MLALVDSDGRNCQLYYSNSSSGKLAPSKQFYSSLNRPRRCYKCHHSDVETKENACIKKFALSSSYVEEECDGKCLKAYEKIEARTKEELLKDERTPTIRKCVSQTELEHLQAMKITIKSGCHTARTTKTKHKIYCFCSNDLCNSGNNIWWSRYLAVLSTLFIFLIITH